jgi:plasmid maintenance system antidote protein VapI
MARMKSKSSTTIDVDPGLRRLPPLHVGEVLREEFLPSRDLSPYARYFGTTAEFWMNLQTAHELETAKPLLASKLAKITPRPSHAARKRSGNRARAA